MLILLRVLVDFGLVVLAWIVQLVIYPGFSQTKASGFQDWHKRYTRSISYIVAPLMIGQLVITVVQLFQTINTFSVVSLTLCIFTWLNTFVWAIPLHTKLGNGEDVEPISKALVQVNIPRTIFWSVMFVYSLAYYWPLFKTL